MINSPLLSANHNKEMISGTAKSREHYQLCVASRRDVMLLRAILTRISPSYTKQHILSNLIVKLIHNSIYNFSEITMQYKLLLVDTDYREFVEISNVLRLITIRKKVIAKPCNFYRKLTANSPYLRPHCGEIGFDFL